MLKVFLAEDEFVVREGIKNNVDWKAHGYEFCGEAGDGELAYSMIQTLRPDIVITDIKMPFMDGLTLSKMVRAAFPDTEIVLLTGYEDFEYAKEAIKIGVCSYLSKPISGENLLKEIDAVAAKIEEKTKEREIAKRYEEDMKERTELDKREFFEDLVTGKRDLPYLLNRAKELSLNITALRYNVLILRIRSIKHGTDEYSGSVVGVLDKLAYIVSDSKALLFDLNLDGKAILFKGDSDEEINHNIENAIAQMKELFASYPHIRYFGGVGQVVERISDIPSSFTWANRAYAHQYLTSESDFLFGSEEGLHSQRDDIILSEIDPKHIDRRLVKEFLRMGDESETEVFLDEFFKGMGKNAIRSSLLRQYISMDIYFTVSDFVMNELGLAKEEVDAQVPQSDMFSDENSTRDYLVEILKKGIILRKRSSQSHYREVIGDVITYIDRHYSDEELSLNTLAAHVNFSPNHLSAVFRQEMGQTFIKYLTDYRLDKAKELLLSTSKKSNEIGSMVGYKDPHYFSYLFKKTTGMTTTQYRGKGRMEDEE